MVKFDYDKQLKYGDGAHEDVGNGKDGMQRFHNVNMKDLVSAIECDLIARLITISTVSTFKFLRLFEQNYASHKLTWDFESSTCRRWGTGLASSH